jgi:hypothetical protein
VRLPWSAIVKNEVVTEVHHTLDQLREEEGSKGLLGGGGFDETVVVFTTRWVKAKMWATRWFFGEVVPGMSGYGLALFHFACRWKVCCGVTGYHRRSLWCGNSAWKERLVRCFA